MESASPLARTSARDSSRKGLQGAGDIAFALLELTAAAADAFPPLKSAAAGSLHIISLVKKFKSNKEEWTRFGEYIRDAVACIINALPNSQEPREDLRHKIEKLHSTLLAIGNQIQGIKSGSVMSRAMHFIKDPGKILQMRVEVDAALSLFHDLMSHVFLTNLTSKMS